MLIEADNGRNKNSFSIGLRNAWQEGFDVMAKALEQEQFMYEAI